MTISYLFHINQMLPQFLLLFVVSTSANVIQTSTEDPKSGCMPGMELWNDWCYAFDKATKEFCYDTYGASPPSINSVEETMDLMALRYQHIGYMPYEPFFYIVLECDSDHEWYWYNGEEWSGYTNFLDGTSGLPCDPNDDHVLFGHFFNEGGTWQSSYTEVRFGDAHFQHNFITHYYVCARRPFGNSKQPDYFDSTSSTPSNKDDLFCSSHPWCKCENGMELRGDWCLLAQSVLPTDYDFGQYTCEGYGASLPSVSTEQESNDLINLSPDIFGNSATDVVYIGLECNPEGKWIWKNQEQWRGDYAQFVEGENSSSCDPTHTLRYLINRYGQWVHVHEFDSNSWDSRRRPDYVICSVRPIGYNQPPPSTTEHPDEITSEHSTATTTSSSTETTNTSSSASTRTETPTSIIPDPTSTLTKDDTAGFPFWVIILIVLAVTLLLIVVGTVLCWNRRKKVTHIERTGSNDPMTASREIPKKFNRYYAHSLFPPGTIDEWEIDRKFVGIDYLNELGEGAFGCVYMGRFLVKDLPTPAWKSIVELAAVRNSNDAVAVKMLHESADQSAMIEFKNEIDMMKSIGYHERLGMLSTNKITRNCGNLLKYKHNLTLNLLACVTLSEPVQLISEYCSNGDLLEFMRQRREYMRINQENADENRIITAKKQIMYAIQIAYGLEYLSSRGFVHRDIAARNIMVDQHETCKIGDFGLCRLIGREDEHYHSQGGKMPLKWMPPEAIEKFEFSAASDVWSYGVLLFEIITLGGAPYAGWLKYELMSQCWMESPSERPGISELRLRLGWGSYLKKSLKTTISN